MLVSTRVVEVIRVGTIGLDINYPGKQVVRLRDVSGLYTGGPLTGLAKARQAAEKYKRGKRIAAPDIDPLTVPDETQVEPALTNLAASIEDLHDRLRGKRLAGINVEVWDQISGAYLGAINTDENGTLVLPTDTKFVEALQWQLAGGGYSDCFNGERAAGTPGLFFYFPCNEGGRETVIKSFPGVSGQQAELPTGWEWYDSGFFNRPALKYVTGANLLQLLGATPEGRRSFQFLWYCSNPSPDRTIFQYSCGHMGADFALEVYYDGQKSVLRGVLAVGTSEVQYAPGNTALSSDTWYLIQIITLMYGGYEMTVGERFGLKMEVHIGGIMSPELTLQANPLVSNIQNTSLVHFLGVDSDGFDELRHLERELYESEIFDYGDFLKKGKVTGKSQGKLGSIGW